MIAVSSAVASILAQSDFLATFPAMLMAWDMEAHGPCALKPPVELDPVKARFFWSSRLARDAGGRSQAFGGPTGAAIMTGAQIVPASDRFCCVNYAPAQEGCGSALSGGQPEQLVQMPDLANGSGIAIENVVVPDGADHFDTFERGSGGK